MNVIAVLDGDKRKEDFAQENKVYCLPFDNVEAALYQYYMEDDFPYRLSEGKGFNGPKDLFNSLRRDRIMSTETINHYLCDRMEEELEEFASILRQFLSQE